MSLYSNQTKTKEFQGEHFVNEDDYLYDPPRFTPGDTDMAGVWFIALAVVCLIVAVVI